MARFALFPNPLSRGEARRCVGQRLPMSPPFRAAWQMAARPCITFPLPPLKFRTAGFPQYGFKPDVNRNLHPLGLICGHQPKLRSTCFRRSESATGAVTYALRSRGPWLAGRLSCPARSSLTMASSEPLGLSYRFGPVGLFGRSLPCGRRPRGSPIYSARPFCPCRLPYPGGSDGG